MISSEKLRKVEIAICIELSKTQKIIENLWKFCSLFVTTEVSIKHLIWIKIVELKLFWIRIDL